jgi:hypothetical protein
VIPGWPVAPDWRATHEDGMTTDTASAVQTRRTFFLSCSVAIRIAAPTTRVWQLLTDADRYTQWNTTLTSLEGPIVPGGVVKMTVPEAPGRTFSPKVTAFDINRRMVWRDGFAPMFVGERTFTLEPEGPEDTRFTMTETFTGLMLPLIAGRLPNFGPIFERYAADLRRAAEATPLADSPRS